MSTANELSITAATTAIRQGELSPVELVQACLDRIAAVDAQVQAWVMVCEEQALEQAAALEQRIRQGQPVGPLCGVTLGAKDIFWTAGIPTRANSQVDPEFVPPEDATVIARLQQAGAILLGKVTTTEYAAVRNKPGVPPTCNPWNLQHTPGGSSGGSGAALAAGTALLTLGTQTGGSLLRPAAYHGLTSLKGSYGLFSRFGVMPVSWCLDHPGPMARTVADIAAVSEVMAGVDPKDPYTLDRPVPSYRSALGQPIQGMTLGIPDRYFNEAIDPQVQAAFDQALEVFKNQGVQIRAVTLPECFEIALKAHRIVLDVEAAAVHQDRYSQVPDRFGLSLRQRIEPGYLVPAVDYLRAQRIRALYVQEMAKVFAQVDALAMPTTPTPAPLGIDDTGSPRHQVPFSNAGTPTLTIPIGITSDTNLPIGLQLAAGSLQESTLITFGDRYQHLTDWHTRRAAVAVPVTS